MKLRFLCALLGIGVMIGGGLAVLGLFPPGRDSRGIFREYSSPRSTFKSYLSAVLAVEEEYETATEQRLLYYRTMRYRGWEAYPRWWGLSAKSRAYSQQSFHIRAERRWGRLAQLLVAERGATGNENLLTYSFLLRNGRWLVSNVESGNRLRY